eukprot:COSAG06_NODE_4834_length_3921_cov_7.706960_5_plen_150_part_00
MVSYGLLSLQLLLLLHLLLLHRLLHLLGLRWLLLQLLLFLLLLRLLLLLLLAQRAQGWPPSTCTSASTSSVVADQCLPAVAMILHLLLSVLLLGGGGGRHTCTRGHNIPPMPTAKKQHAHTHTRLTIPRRSSLASACRVRAFNVYAVWL